MAFALFNGLVVLPIVLSHFGPSLSVFEESNRQSNKGKKGSSNFPNGGQEELELEERILSVPAETFESANDQRQ